jgi:HlyD family secretion protein
MKALSSHLFILLVTMAIVTLLAVWRVFPISLNAAEESSVVNQQSVKRVAALGRIEPNGGTIRLAGPPRPAVVIGQLLVKEGDLVEQGQVMAVLADIEIYRAEVSRIEAELANAEHELKRNQSLYKKKALSESDWRGLQLVRDIANANLAKAKAEQELSTVRSPITGQVIAVHSREGERVGLDGIIELGETAAMYAVAEVYETDVGHIRLGQRALIRSMALPHEITGRIERIGLMIGKKDVLSTDPVADADARVVEVDIRLDQPELVAALTNLRVEILIEP